jgi:hypothetical protein
MNEQWWKDMSNVAANALSTAAAAAKDSEQWVEQKMTEWLTSQRFVQREMLDVALLRIEQLEERIKHLEDRAGLTSASQSSFGTQDQTKE